MGDFGASIQTELTERIMARVRTHVQRDMPGDARNYNAVYEGVHAVLTEHFERPTNQGGPEVMTVFNGPFKGRRYLVNQDGSRGRRLS